MLRNPAVLAFRNYARISLRSVKSSVNYKPHLLQNSNFSYVLLARNQSTGTVPEVPTTELLDQWSSPVTEALSSDSSVIKQVSPLPPPTELAAPPELVFTPIDQASSPVVTDAVVQAVQSIPEPPPLPVPTPLEEIVVALASNGEPALQSMGLAGWSPSGMVQQAMQFLHCDVGLPWFLAIATGTLIIRSLLFPLVLKSQRTAARMHNEMPKMQVIQKKMTEARNSGDALMAQKYSNDLAMFMREKDLNPLKSLIVPIAMAPIFMSFFFGLRGMANLPVESMKTGGIYWFTDLTVPDPYYILPVITSLTLWLTLETGADSARLSANPQGHMMKYFFRAMPVIMFPFIMNFPAALLCYWASTNMVSLIQVSFLKIPKVREYFNIPALKKHSPDSLPTKSKGFVKDAKEAWTNVKVSKQVEERARFDEEMFKRAGRAPITKTYRYDPTKVQGGVQAKPQN